MHLHQHLVLANLVIQIRSGYLIVVSSHVFLVTNAVANLPMCLFSFRISSLVKWLFKYFTHFYYVACFLIIEFWELCMYCFVRFICFAKISFSVACLFTLLIVSFEEQKCFKCVFFGCICRNRIKGSNISPCVCVVQVTSCQAAFWRVRNTVIE